MMRKLLIGIVVVLLLAGTAWADYTMPIGIPDPALSFGGTLDPIDTPTPDWPASWNEGTTSATEGYYYIDKTDGNATDSGNTYGHPDLPRASIPEGALSAGDFIYVHAGTYTAADSGGDRFNWYGTGTSANPIWITGNPTTNPIFQDHLHIADGGSASYIIFENFEFSGSAAWLETRPTTDGHTVDHLVIRNCTMTGAQVTDDRTPINIGPSSSTDYIPNSTINYTVVYNNTISNYGDKSSTEECGVYAGYHTDYTWVLNNTIFSVGADSLGGCHYADNGTKKTEHYYIGGNTLYGNGENGIDLKGARYVIISENTIYGPYTREQGYAIVLHYGAPPSTTVKDAWVIFNKIYSVSGGIYTSSVGCDNLTILGNIIYDVKASYAAQVDALNGYCVRIAGGNGTFRIVDNTFYQYDKGLDINDLDGTDTCSIHGNIFHTRNSTDNYEIEEGTDESKIDIDYNQYYPVAESAAFNWGGSERTLSYMQNTASECAHGAEGDPKLVNPTTDFSLQSDSPCVDASVEHAAYDAFYTAYSISIEKDYDGTARPQNSVWDMGAYEYGGSSGSAAFSAGAGSVSFGAGDGSVGFQ